MPDLLAAGVGTPGGGAMNRVAFIFRTDTHVADQGPVSWKADYPTEIWSSLKQIGQFAREHKAKAVLDGGDYFHVKAASRNSHALVVKSAEIQNGYPCPTWSIEGNHDVKYNNLDTIVEQPLGVLFASGVFNHLRDQTFTDGDVTVRVVGVPYSPDRTLADLLAVQKGSEDYLVCLVHALAAENPPASVEDFFGEPVFRYVDLVTDNGPDVWCFPPQTPILDWLYRPVPIETVGESVAVLGRSGPTVVEAVHPIREVSESLVRLDIEGVPPLVSGATVEHPYWVVRGLQCVLPSRSTRRCHPDKSHTSYPCTTCTKAPIVKGDWCKAGEIEAGDYVALPVPAIPVAAPSTPGLANEITYKSS